MGKQLLITQRIKQHTYHLCAGALFITPATFALAAPIDAVIGLNNSQIIETSDTLSLSPIPNTLLPLLEGTPAISHSQPDVHTHWLEEIGKEIRVEHKQRDLSYTGILTEIDNMTGTFVISKSSRSTHLPITDFYLIPLEKKKADESERSDITMSYQTNQLSWTPQLSLILEDGYVSLIQYAMLHNHSKTPLVISNGLLHNTQNSTAPKSFTSTRSALEANFAQPSVTYQDNEISYPLGKEAISITPYSDLLYPLPRSKSKIEKQINVASLYTHNSHAGKIDLNFENQLSFTFAKDALPGQYSTFWQRDGLLIPSNQVTLDTVREGNSVNIITNKSQDITGNLTLVNATSTKLPSIQTWQAVLINHSDKTQSYSIKQTTNGVISTTKGKDVKQISAKEAEVFGEIKAHSKKLITYKIELKN